MQIEIIAARYADAEHAAINFDLTVDGVATPFSYIAGDGAPLSLALAEILISAPPSIAPYVAPPSPAPQSITRRQLMIGLVQAGIITAEEWQTSYSTGDLPGAVQAAVATLPTEAERIAAKITWAEMEGAARNHPLVALLAAHTSLSSEQVDDMFRAWAGL